MAYSFIMVLVLAGLTSLVHAADVSWRVVARAQPDEFRAEAGGRYVPFGREPEGAAGFAKINHDYIWSMASAGSTLWFGDVANIVCLAAAADPENPVIGNVAEGLYRSCDYAAGPYPGVPRWIPPSARARIGDWRPPDIWRYHPSGGGLQRMTPPDPRIFKTVGFRAAGANGAIVFFAGPNLYGRGIHLFAFAARSGLYLGSTTLIAYGNIRQFVTVGSALYTAVENEAGGGSILRWTGTLQEPFAFQVVGRVDATPMYIAEHQGRLYVTTWPGGEGDGAGGEGVTSGLWMSPSLGRFGLFPLQAGGWRKVWDVSSYEPDPLIARTLGLGALRSWRGALYWGTMQLPGEGYAALTERYGLVGDRAMTLDRTTRSVALFRGAPVDGVMAVELLYGDLLLPVFQPATRTWVDVPNRVGAPVFGAAGFGYPGNVYTWSMAVHKDKLYIGTLDTSTYAFGDAIVAQQPAPADVGADLFVIVDRDQPAVAITTDGGGNPFNQGFRNLVSFGSALYVGTANASNLQDLGPGQRGGGWELLSLE